MSGSRSRLLFRAFLVLFALGVCLLLLMFLLGLALSPRGGAAGGKARPAITISKETTHLTEPLRPDGYVDYLAAINAEHSAGVTPENNAAVDLVYAMGTSTIYPDIRREYFKRLGVAPPPEPGDYARPLKDFEAAGQSAPAQDAAQGEVDPEAALEEAGEIEPSDPSVEVAPAETPKRPNVAEEQGLAMQRPWTPEEFPRLAAWLAANQGPIDRIAQATSKPRWYTPMISSDGLLMSVLLPQAQDSREAGRMLATRAMQRLGQGDAEGAWQDLLACHRLARLVSRGASLVERLVGIAIDGMACNGDRALALHGKLPAARLVEMQTELAKLPPLPPMVDSLDHMERYSFLSTCSTVARDGPLVLGQLTDGPAKDDHLLGRALNGLAHHATDWNIPLRMGNDYFDRMVAMSKEPDRAARAARFDALEAELRAAQDAAGTAPDLADLFHIRQQMGQRMGQILTSLLLPGVRAALDAEQRSAATLSLTRLAFSLAAYRADHDNYPEKLAELAPKYIAALPANLGGGQALRYQATADGYELVWFGPNEQDEQGRDRNDQPPGDDVRIGVPLTTE